MKRRTGQVVKCNANEVARGIAVVADFLPKVAWSGLRVWANRHVMKELKRNAPARRLRQAVNFHAYARRDLPFVRIFCNLPLGAWFEYGTGIHGPLKKRIEPRTGESYTFDGVKKQRRALRIPTKKGVLYRMWSPGMKAQPWFFRSIKDKIQLVAPTIAEVFQKAAQREMRRAAKKAAAAGA